MSDRILRAVALLQQSGRVTSGELAAVCGVSAEAARVTLCELASVGILQAEGARRGRYYRRADARPSEPWARAAWHVAALPVDRFAMLAVVPILSDDRRDGAL